MGLSSGRTERVSVIPLEEKILGTFVVKSIVIFGSTILVSGLSYYIILAMTGSV